jgi:hypothetical protein
MTIAPRAEGSLVPCPGIHRLRAIATTRGQRRYRFPLAGAGDDTPLVLDAPAGRVVVYDVDRDLVGHEISEGWEGVEMEMTVSPLLPAALAPPASESWARTRIVRHLGGSLVLWVFLLAILSLLVARPLPLILGASFTHYLVYLSALAHGPGLSYGEMLRDAIAQKTVSMTLLGGLYLLHPCFEPLSAALILGGVGLSLWAASSLGMSRTYFGAELGIVPPARIEAAPYGLVPHPMILGSLIALLGVQLQPELRAAHPWLAPAHAALYLNHLAQEHHVSRRSNV